MSESATTRRVRLSVGGAAFDTFTEVEIARDLAEISGSFVLRAWAPRRSRAFLGGASNLRDLADAAMGQEARIEIDGEPALLGWVEDLEAESTADSLGLIIAGRDRAGDLVDCAAAPDGPGEYRDLTLTEIVARIAAPFGLTVRAEVDVGARFPRFGLEPDELAIAAISKACRQRAVLCVSDGVGGLVLTRGGTNRGPAPIRLGEAPFRSRATITWRDRYSEVIVKGQTEAAGGNRQPAAALDSTAEPLGSGAALPRPAAPAREARGVLMTGRARDAAVTRHRPKVVLAETQSGGASVQEQADWQVRIQRGRSTTPSYTVPDWRAGEQRRLWRPNEVVLLDDPFAGFLEEMIVAGVTYRWGDAGAETELRLAGRTAFDVLRQGDERQAQRTRGPGRALDAEARPLGSGA